MKMILTNKTMPAKYKWGRDAGDADDNDKDTHKVKFKMPAKMPKMVIMTVTVKMKCKKFDEKL